MTTTHTFGTYFGEEWPSGVCDEGYQVETPVGEHCALCGEVVGPFDQGSFMGTMTGEEGHWVPAVAPAHRECSLREVLGGIGHLKNHSHWCGEMHDPDGGVGYRESALLVWNWVSDHGFPTRPEQ